MRASKSSRGKAGRLGERNTHTHTLSAVERLEDRALMAADVGLVGVGLNGPGLPSAAAQFSMAPPAGLIGSALSGSSAAAGLILGASAAPQVVLPAVSFGGVVSGISRFRRMAPAVATVFFVDDVASHYSNELPLAPWE